MDLATLGPFDVEAVDDDILGDVVYNQGVPIIVKQLIDDKTKYAVVAKNRELRIICAGCFKRDMSLADDSRCKKVCSFLKHWDNKDGLRRQKCKNVGNEGIATVARNAMERTIAVDRPVDDRFVGVETADLIKELKKRGAVTDVLKDVEDTDFVDEMKTRGIKALFGARRTWLIHELRRQARRVSEEAYYHNAKENGGAHSSDEVGCTLHEVEEGGIETRRTKRKVVNTEFELRDVGDYR